MTFTEFNELKHKSTQRIKIQMTESFQTHVTKSQSYTRPLKLLFLFTYFIKFHFSRTLFSFLCSPVLFFLFSLSNINFQFSIYFSELFFLFHLLLSISDVSSYFASQKKKIIFCACCSPHTLFLYMRQRENKQRFRSL